MLEGAELGKSPCAGWTRAGAVALQARGLPAARLTCSGQGSPKLSHGGTGAQSAPKHCGGARGPVPGRCHRSELAWAACACPHVPPEPALPSSSSCPERRRSPGPVAAGQLGTISARLALSSRICTPAPAPSPGRHFQVRGGIQHRREIPISPPRL